MTPQGSPPGEMPLSAALEALRRLERQLREAQKMEVAGLLAAGLGHDFNNMLTIIEGYTALLLESGELHPESRELVRNIRQAGRHAAVLTKALVRFSRSVSEEKSAVDLNLCVRDLAALVKRLLPTNIELTIAAGPRLKTVLADPGGIPHALLNLVFNSRNAMPEGGQLEIRTANLTIEAPAAEAHPGIPPGCYVLLTVSDTGRGMDEELRRRIFEPFYTHRPAEAGAGYEAGHGSGLGLPMVQHIVKENGGFLSVESQKDKGTAVRIYLPCLEDRAGKTEPAKPLPRGTERILLVEDGGAIRRLLHAMLESVGYSVLEASSAAEARAVADGFEGGIDLLVTNEALADSSGLELAERLRETRPLLAMMCLSEPSSQNASGGAPEPAVPSKASSGGLFKSGTDFLAKPFTMEALFYRVRRLLDAPKPRRVLFVDEDPDLAMFAMRVLRRAGFEVLVAGNWKVAVDTVQTDRPDLLITDLVVAHRENPDAMEALNRVHPSLPVVATSELAGALLKTAEALGARATLAKPFSAAELLAAVRRALGSTR